MTDIGLLSLNVRGLRDKPKRDKIFRWLKNQKQKIIFLQETHSCLSDESVWAREWGSNIYFSHGQTNSSGTAILTRCDLILNKKISDDFGYYLILVTEFLNYTLILVNIYSPIPNGDQKVYYEKVSNELIKLQNTLDSCIFILGGDFNNILDENLDRYGGNYKPKTQGKQEIINIINNFNLIDIFRHLHPDVKKYTWRRNKPVIQSRLDYWLISEDIQDFVKKSDVYPVFLSDHSSIILDL
ncbi:hypothetical protein LOTGIDRAFT_123325, partial [Lottia gigantea]